jgi:adenosylhomocysteine nucleosidase
MRAASLSDFDPIGVLVGMEAEARLLRGLGWPVAIGGGTSEGAARAVRSPLLARARALLSCGFAGGLDPVLRPGDLIVPSHVLVGSRRIAADPILADLLGGATPHVVVAHASPVTDPQAKQALRRSTGGAAVDLETAAVAQVAEERGVPFAVLRAICDPAERGLPRAAIVALAPDGRVAWLSMVRAIAAAPGELGALFMLARDAAAARRGLRARIATLGYAPR